MCNFLWAINIQFLLWVAALRSVNKKFSGELQICSYEIYCFGLHFLGHHYYMLNLPYLCPGVERAVVNKYINFTLINQIWSPLWKGGAWNLQFLVFSPYLMLHTKFGKGWPSSSWKGDVYAWWWKWRTPTNSNRLLEWLGWPKNCLI